MEDQEKIAKSLANMTFPALGRLIVYLDPWLYTDLERPSRKRERPDTGRVRLLTSLFDLIERSEEKSLHMGIYGGPKTIVRAFAGHSICHRITSLNLEISKSLNFFMLKMAGFRFTLVDTITENDGYRRSEAFHFNTHWEDHPSFPALNHLSCRGFLPFLNNFRAPTLKDVKYGCDPRKRLEEGWDYIELDWLNPQIQSLHLIRLRQPLGNHTAICARLTWLCLEHFTVIGPIKSWLLLPNLRTLVWKLDDKAPVTSEYMGEVLSKDGMFGSIDSLHRLELHSFPLNNEDPYISRISNQILLQEHLKVLRMKSCDIKANFIEPFLGVQEGTHSFLQELEEISFIGCDLEVSVQDLKAHFCGRMPYVTLTLVPKEQITRDSPRLSYRREMEYEFWE
jgi:hypothetical protein